jgi:hypothetical protein
MSVCITEVLKGSLCNFVYITVNLPSETHKMVVN